MMNWERANAVVGITHYPLPITISPTTYKTNKINRKLRKLKGFDRNAGFKSATSRNFG